MPWYLILTAGLILGALADRALIVLSDYLTGRPVTPVQTRPASSTPEAVTPKRHGAADIIGCKDLGGRYIAPTHPVTRGARNSVTALAAWDRRNRRGVA
mgnify:CR=1 FL=1